MAAHGFPKASAHGFGVASAHGFRGLAAKCPFITFDQVGYVDSTDTSKVATDGTKDPLYKHYLGEEHRLFYRFEEPIDFIGAIYCFSGLETDDVSLSGKEFAHALSDIQLVRDSDLDLENVTWDNHASLDYASVNSVADFRLLLTDSGGPTSPNRSFNLETPLPLAWRSSTTAYGVRFRVSIRNEDERENIFSMKAWPTVQVFDS